MRCIGSGLGRVQPLCRGATIWRPSSIFHGPEVSQKLPSVAAIVTSELAHMSSGSALPGGCFSKPMQSCAAPQSRSLHVAAGQGACMGPIEELHPRELQEMLERVSQEGAGDVQLIDVREDFEHQTASLPGFKLMPMSRLQDWAQNIHDEMDADKETVLLCHMGVRSMRVAGFLASQGFTKLRNVTGGIDAYSREVDSSVPLY